MKSGGCTLEPHYSCFLELDQGSEVGIEGRSPDEGYDEGGRRRMWTR